MYEHDLFRYDHGKDSPEANQPIFRDVKGLVR